MSLVKSGVSGVCKVLSFGFSADSGRVLFKVLVLEGFGCSDTGGSTPGAAEVNKSVLVTEVVVAEVTGCNVLLGKCAERSGSEGLEVYSGKPRLKGPWRGPS